MLATTNQRPKTAQPYSLLQQRRRNPGKLAITFFGFIGQKAIQGPKIASQGDLNPECLINQIIHLNVETINLSC